MNAAMSTTTSQHFEQYRKILDFKHDKYESLVKISRDLTIASKKIIFHLHRVSRSSNHQKIIEEAGKMFESCVKKCFIPAVQQLEDCDKYRFMRAISPGIQEFVEAYTFYIFLKSSKLPCIDEIQTQIVEYTKSSDSDSDRIITAAVIPMPPLDFVLGIADFTGEVMRLAISSISSNSSSKVSDLCHVLQQTESYFSKYCSNTHEMHQKMSTMRTSLSKVESACYALRIRGSETPSALLMSTLGEDDSPPC